MSFFVAIVSFKYFDMFHGVKSGHVARNPAFAALYIVDFGAKNSAACRNWMTYLILEC